jgi:hypothetical protein
MAWLEEEVSSIHKAPNDTGFLGRCSLIKSVQSVWHVTYKGDKCQIRWVVILLCPIHTK